MIYGICMGNYQKSIEESAMPDRINVTEIGRSYFEMEHINISADDKGPAQNRKPFQLPRLGRENIQNDQDHRRKLHDLPHKLNKLYNRKSIREAQQQANQSIRNLEEELLKDIGNRNEYISKKAQTIANGMFIKMGHEKHSLPTEVSKNRNYLARINNLHKYSEEKYHKMTQIIRQKSRSPRGHDEY